MGGRRKWEKRGQEAGFTGWQEEGEKGKITQHCKIFCNRKRAKWRESQKRMSWDLRVKEMASLDPLPSYQHRSKSVAKKTPFLFLYIFIPLSGLGDIK